MNLATIIPALDLLNGQVVRLRQGKSDCVLNYGLSPCDTAAIFLGWGLQLLQLIDIQAGKSGTISAMPLISKLKKTGMDIHYGGGIRTIADAEACFKAGADLLFHILINLRNQHLSLKDVIEVLKTRGEKNANRNSTHL